MPGGLDWESSHGVGGRQTNRGCQLEAEIRKITVRLDIGDKGKRRLRDDLLSNEVNGGSNY